MLKRQRCLSFLAIFCLLVGATPSAMGQSPVRIMSGFPPGGGVDAVARLLADHLAKQTGKPHVVENKTGAGGVIAVQAMLTAPVDGSILLLAPDSNIVIYPHTVAAPGFDALIDLVPVAKVASYDLALSTAGGENKIKDFSSFRVAAKADPKVATFASPAAGSLQHFYGLAVGKAADVELMHIAYRGVAPAVTDTIGGIVTALVTPVGPVLQHAEAGRLRILATSGEARGSKTPNVPTLKELGFPQLVARGWFGLFAPSATSSETVQRIARQVRTALDDAEFQAKLAALDMDASWTSPDHFKTQLDAENRNWARIVKDSGFRANQ